MKRFITLFFCISTTCHAEIVKVAEFGEFKNVEFFVIEGERVRFSHKDGIGIIPLKDIPKEIQDKILKEVPKTDMVAKQEAEAKAKREELKKLFREDFGGKLRFTVIQIVNGGALIKVRPRDYTSIKQVAKKTIIYREYEIFGSSGMGRRPSYAQVPVESIKMVSETIDLNTNGEPLFLYCDTSNMHDGQTISGIEVYPAGTYTYDSVGKVTKTVKALTTDLDKSLQLLLNSIQQEKAQK